MRRNFIFTFLILCSTSLILRGSSNDYFDGNKAFDDQRLSKYLEEKGVKLSELDREKSKLDRPVRLIRTFYSDRGYPLTNVGIKSRSSHLFFLIDEGPRARLKQLSFNGANSFSSKQLNAFFKVGDWWDEGGIEAGIENIRQFYRDSGFLKFGIKRSGFDLFKENTTDFFPIPFRKEVSQNIRLEYEIDEGPQFHFGNTELPSLLDGTAIEQNLRGKVFNDSNLQNFKEQITRFFWEKDHLVKNLDLDWEIDNINQTVNLRVEVEPYPLLIINRIDFTGNRHLPDSFYRRELVFSEQDILSPLELEKSVLRLAGTGALKNISSDDIELAINLQHSEVDVCINLKEKGRKRFAFSLDRDGLKGDLLFSVLNLLGLGETLGVNLTTGDMTTGLVVSLASRYLIGTNIPVNLALGFFNRHTGFQIPGLEDHLRELLSLKHQGITGSFDFRVTEKNYLGSSILFEQTKTHAGIFKHFMVEPYWTQKSVNGLDRNSNIRASNRLSFWTNNSLSWNLRPSLMYQRQIKNTQSSQIRFRLKTSHQIWFGSERQWSDSLFFNSTDLRGFQNSISGSWASSQNQATPIGNDTLLSLSLEGRCRLAGNLILIPFLDLGMSATLKQPANVRIIGQTRRIFRTSTGSELKVELPGKLPAIRFTSAWNPLRLNHVIQISEPPVKLLERAFYLGFSVE